MTKLRTEELDADIASLARGITDAGCDSFSTKTLSYFKKADTASMELWLECWKDPRNGQWVVERHESTVLPGKSGENDVNLKKKTVAKNVCFFDAVDYCASFEEHEKTQGAMAEDRDGSYFRDVAELAGIPFDKVGIPHPAAFGRILTDGRFDEGAYKIAATTKGKTIKEVSQAEYSTNMSSELVKIPESDKKGTALVPIKESLVSSQQKMKLARQFELALNAAHSTSNTLRLAIVNSFHQQPMMRGLGPRSTDNPMHLMATMFTFGAYYPLYCLMSYDSERKKFLRAQAKLDVRTRDLPDGEAKKLLQDFSKAAGVAFSMAQASYIYSECKRGTLSEKKLKQGLSLIDKACKAAGEDKEKAETLKEAYLQGLFPDEPYHFYDELHEQYGKVAEAISPLMRR